MLNPCDENMENEEPERRGDGWGVKDPQILITCFVGLIDSGRSCEIASLEA